MVDVGSHLGLTALTLHATYPQSNLHIVSIEAVPVNWLYQRITLARNLPADALARTTVWNVAVTNDEFILALSQQQEGSHNATTVRLPLAWQAFDTGAATTWPVNSDQAPAIITWKVPARTLTSLLAQSPSIPSARQQASPPLSTTTNIDVLILDCQGCEYAIVPTLTATTTHIRYATGSLHWGNLPPDAKPSSAHAQATHDVLCRFADSFGRTAKECCGTHMPQQAPPTAAADDDLCRDFDAWAVETRLHTIPHDMQGWQYPSGVAGLSLPNDDPPESTTDDVAANIGGDDSLTEEEIRLIGGDDVL